MSGDGRFVLAEQRVIILPRSGLSAECTLVRHYVRTDLIERKVHVLSAWDERLQGIVTGREAEKVVSLRKAG